jgi:plasmid maintenance system antidote protein VapI
VRLGNLCGNGPSLWLEMQTAYDLWHAERKLGRGIASISDAAAGVTRSGHCCASAVCSEGLVN